MKFMDVDFDLPDEAYCEYCGKEMEFVDDSFGHHFGTDVFHYWECDCLGEEGVCAQCGEYVGEKIVVIDGDRWCDGCVVFKEAGE